MVERRSTISKGQKTSLSAGDVTVKLGRARVRHSLNGGESGQRQYRYVPTENLGVDPVTENEETVTEGEELRDVSRTPEAEYKTIGDSRQ